MMQTELHYDIMEETEEDIDSDSEADMQQQVLSVLPSGHQQAAAGVSEVRPVEEVRPPPGVALPEHLVQPTNQAEDSRECISQVPIVLINAKTDLGVEVLAPKPKHRKLRIMGARTEGPNTAMGRD